MTRTGIRSLYPGQPVIAAFAVVGQAPGIPDSHSQAPKARSKA